MDTDSNVKLFGTDDPQVVLRSVQLGPLSFLYSSEAIRRICWHETELVRAIAWPVRDANWGTFAPVILEETISISDRNFEGHLRFSVGDGALECTLRIQASDAGDLQLGLAMTPTKGPFATNRAGFSVLHPIKGIAGAPLHVTHSGGAVEQTEFPLQISPGQPVFDIQELRYGLDGRQVVLAFSEAIFEMEDQRNWSDASYKTYCGPLVFPFTYEISDTKSQSISIMLSGDGVGNAEARTGRVVTLQRSSEVAPDIGLAVEPGWVTDSEAIQLSGAGHLRVRVGPDAIDEDFGRLVSDVQAMELDLELIMSDDIDPAVALRAARDQIRGAGLAPSRIIALRQGYLASHQPNGPWPGGPDPAKVVQAARIAFPEAQIGGGMLTNFTEFNRCQPDPDVCDFVTHANSAIVHAADDLSVSETLEALPQVFESAWAIGHGKPYRLGLVSIGMRSNPYGAAVADNPGQVRRTMARDDPRQRGLFAAAWAVGVLAATQTQHVEALCLAAPEGPFGIAYRRQIYPQAYFDQTPDARYYPIFHVVKAAAAMAGRARLHVSGLPEGVHAYGVETESGSRIMVANLSPETKTVSLRAKGRTVLMSCTTFTDATTHADWLETAPQQEGNQLILNGFAVAFIEE